MYMYSHPKVDRISGISKKKVPENTLDRILESQNDSKIRVDDWKETQSRMITKGVIQLVIWFRIACLGLWNDHKKVLLCLCIRFWHANFTLKSSKENCNVAVSSQKSQRVNINEDMGIQFKKATTPKMIAKILPTKVQSCRCLKRKLRKEKG